MKKFGFALAALALAGSASAAVYDGISFSSSLTDEFAGSGTETFTFTLDSASTFSAGVTSFSLRSGANLTAVLNGTYTFTQSAAGAGFFNYTLSGVNLDAGPHSLKITATGAYAGEATITPVPEPESLALAVAGLGVAGFVARRRKSA